MLVGDVRQVLRTLPHNSVDYVWGSPPFWNLRSYLAGDHPMKAFEIGSEETPAGYLDTMLELTEEFARVLTPHGSLGFEIGDSSSGSGGAGGDYESGGLREGQNRFDGTAAKARRNGSENGDARRRATRVKASMERGKPDGGSWSNRQVDVELGIRPATVRFRGERDGYPLDKSLCMIPSLYAASLAYGRNLLRTPVSLVDALDHIDKCIADGMPVEDAVQAAHHLASAFPDHTFEKWRVRNFAVWIKPNPTIGREGDKLRRATSFITMACRSADRWFDLDAVRKENPRANEFSRTRAQLNRGNPGFHTGEDDSDATQNPLGAPPMDYFIMSPSQYRGSHYACVDDATEALTPTGWRPHDQLQDGDLIAAYDAASDSVRFEPAKIVRYEIDDEVVSIEKRHTSQRLTLEHRVLVRTRKRPSPFVKLACDLVAGCDVMLTAPWDLSNHEIDGPGPHLAALLGWYIAEGCDNQAAADIYQSESAHPQHCLTIRELLLHVGAKFTEYRRVRPAGAGKAAYETTEICFHVSGPIADWLKSFPRKTIPSEAVFGWPDADAEALHDALVDGDGHRRPDGRMSWCQRDRLTADMFQILSLRLGYRASTHTRESNGITEVSVAHGRWVTLRDANGRLGAIPRERYVGTVWCPQVATTFWLARRNGKPFITGNTMPEQLCNIPIESQCPRRVCRVCGTPSRRVSYVAPSPFSELPGIAEKRGGGRAKTPAGLGGTGVAHGDESRLATTIGWTSCECDGTGELWKDGWHELDAEINAALTAARKRATPKAERKRILVDVVPPLYGRLADLYLGRSDGMHEGPSWRPGVVLDPFGGTGTTGVAASALGRDCILIDLDDSNVDLVRDRVGIFLDDVEYFTMEPVTAAN